MGRQTERPHGPLGDLIGNYGFGVVLEIREVVAAIEPLPCVRSDSP